MDFLLHDASSYIAQVDHSQFLLIPVNESITWLDYPQIVNNAKIISTRCCLL